MREIECGDRIRLADDGRHRFPFEARLPARKNRLIGERRNDAEAIVAGHVRGSEDAHDAGMRGDECVEIAECKFRVVMR